MKDKIFEKSYRVTGSYRQVIDLVDLFEILEEYEDIETLNNWVENLKTQVRELTQENIDLKDKISKLEFHIKMQDNTIAKLYGEQNRPSLTIGGTTSLDLIPHIYKNESQSTTLKY